MKNCQVEDGTLDKWNYKDCPRCGDDCDCVYEPDEEPKHGTDEKGMWPWANIEGEII